MASGSKVLLVEGETDRGFFEIFCRKLGLSVDVQVATPRKLGAWKDTKQAAFNILPDVLENLADAQVERLAVVVDADSEANGGGYERTLEQFADRVNVYGYSMREKAEVAQAGVFFQHDDGLNDVGLWIMPNNADEGMLEDWVSCSLKQEEQDLFDHAVETINNLPGPLRFKELHRAKAEVATWLAWQKRPGEGLYYAAEADLLDESSAAHKTLAAWLERSFG